MFKRFGFWAVAFATLILGLTFSTASAFADSTNILLTFTNLQGFPGPNPAGYVNVNINRTNNTTATITFTSQTNNGYTYYLIDGSAVALNVNGAFTVSATSGFYGFGSGPNGGNGNCNNGTIVGNGCVDTTGQQVDGFGSFNLTVSNKDADTGLTSLSVTLTATGGNTWSNALAVLTGNDHGDVAASHIAPGTSPSSSDRLCTGYAGGTVNTYSVGSAPCGVPEPNPLLLIGCGLLGLAVVGRRMF